MRRTLALSLTTATLLAGCGKTEPQGGKWLTVNTAPITEASFQPSIEAISLLESTTTVSLRPETDGRVVKVLARDGEQVKAGQPIIELDNVQQSAALNAAQAQARTVPMVKLIMKDRCVSTHSRPDTSGRPVALTIPITGGQRTSSVSSARVLLRERT